MSECLTDAELDELEDWGTSPDPSTTRLVVKEIRALRARVAKLEGALKRADLLIMDGFPDGAHVEIRAALKDAP